MHSPWLAAGVTDDGQKRSEVCLRGRKSALTLRAMISDGVWLMVLPQERLDEPMQFSTLGANEEVIDDLAVPSLREWPGTSGGRWIGYAPLE